MLSKKNLDWKNTVTTGEASARMFDVTNFLCQTKVSSLILCCMLSAHMVALFTVPTSALAWGDVIYGKAKIDVSWLLRKTLQPQHQMS